MTGIYKIVLPNNFVYIGQSCNIESRWRNHICPSKAHGIVGAMIAAYGRSIPTFHVVHELPDDVSQDVLNIYERFYIQAYKDAGYNIANKTKGGFSWPIQKVRKPETLDKLRKAQKGRVWSVQQRENVIKSLIARNKARTLPPEERKARVYKKRISKYKPKANPGRTENYGFDNGRSVILVHSDYGIFCTQREAAKMVGKSEQWMGQAMSGKRLKKTTKFIYA